MQSLSLLSRRTSVQLLLTPPRIICNRVSAKIASRRYASSNPTPPEIESNATKTSPAQDNLKDRPSSFSQILATTKDGENSLLAPVHIPEPSNVILKSDHPATNILAQSGIVVQRQIEMMNIFLGFEQANRYVILDPHGNHIGYMAEHDGGLGKAVGRQWFRTHRAFTTHVFDRHSREVLRFHRPFSWINSRIRVYDPLEPEQALPLSSDKSLQTSPTTSDPSGLQQVSHLPLDAMRLIGEAQSEWAPLRRKYHLFLMNETGELSSEKTMQQFANINEPFLSWDFSLLGADGRLLGSVNRSFRGFGRELFTDTGSYVLRMDSAGLEEEAQKSHLMSNTHQTERAYAGTVGGKQGENGMTLDQRAVMLATAVSVDFDYFSRHSRAGGMGFMPLWMGGGGEAAGGAVGGAAGGAAEAGGAAGGAVIGGAGRAVGGAAGSVGAGEGAIAGAGTMAGYEAMQRGMNRGEQPTSEATPQNPSPEQPFDSQSPQSPQTGYDSQSPGSGFSEDQQGEVWGGDRDPWNAASQEPSSGDGDGGGLFSWFWDNFFGGD